MKDDWTLFKIIIILFFQMITPLRSKVSESCMYVSGSAGRKIGKSPFSCVLPTCKPHLYICILFCVDEAFIRISFFCVSS